MINLDDAEKYGNNMASAFFSSIILEMVDELRVAREVVEASKEVQRNLDNGQLMGNSFVKAAIERYDEVCNAKG